jgi:2-haloacid dehalogenase
MCSRAAVARLGGGAHAFTTYERFPVPERPIIVFDVNETLLDLDAIRPFFDRVFHDPAAMRLWFAGLITYSEALTLAGVYVPFTDIGGAVVRMLAATRGITISDADRAELTDRFATMPPHPEVPGALRRLRDHGFRLFTLTDSPPRRPTTRWLPRSSSTRAASA